MGDEASGGFDRLLCLLDRHFRAQIMTGKETRLEEEEAADDVVEMANLTTAQTGVPGTIFISTAMGGHSPRVKYSCSRGARSRVFRLR
jgi:hypothetical protein